MTPVRGIPVDLYIAFTFLFFSLWVKIPFNRRHVLQPREEVHLHLGLDLQGVVGWEKRKTFVRLFFPSGLKRSFFFRSCSRVILSETLKY